MQYTSVPSTARNTLLCKSFANSVFVKGWEDNTWRIYMSTKGTVLVEMKKNFLMKHFDSPLEFSQILNISLPLSLHM